VTETGEPADHHSGCRIPPSTRQVGPRGFNDTPPCSNPNRLKDYSWRKHPDQQAGPATTPGSAPHPPASRLPPHGMSPQTRTFGSSNGGGLATSRPVKDRPGRSDGEVKLQCPPRRTEALPRGRSPSTPKCAKDATSPVPLPARKVAETTEPRGSRPSTTSHRSTGSWGRPGCRVSSAGS